MLRFFYYPFYRPVYPYGPEPPDLARRCFFVFLFAFPFFPFFPFLFAVKPRYRVLLVVFRRGVYGRYLLDFFEVVLYLLLPPYGLEPRDPFPKGPYPPFPKGPYPP